MNVTIVGAGVLGTSLALLLRRAGHRIVAISSRHKRRAQEALEMVGQGEVVGDPGMAVLGADLVLLAVPDRAIPSVAIQVAAGGALKRGAVVAHLAGGLPARVLAGVAAAGGYRGCLHPLQSFADVDNAVRAIPDTWCFVEGDAEAVEVLRRVVDDLGARALEIEGGNKAVYHAGASAASNFLVALVDYARDLLEQAGVPPAHALAALLPLIQGTVANLATKGLPDALTGPIARGDVGTVRGHIEALKALPGDTLRLYRELGRRTVQVALRKGALDRDRAAQMLEALAGSATPPLAEPKTGPEEGGGNGRGNANGRGAARGDGGEAEEGDQDDDGTDDLPGAFRR